MIKEYNNEVDEEVEDELAALEEEMAKKDTQQLPNVNNEPIINNKNPNKKEEDEFNKFMMNL